MPVPFEAPPDELTGLRTFLEEQRDAILRKLDGLSDEQAASHPTASEFCMLTLVKHVAHVERRGSNWRSRGVTSQASGRRPMTLNTDSSLATPSSRSESCTKGSWPRTERSSPR